MLSKGSASDCVFGDASFASDTLSLFELVLGVSPDIVCLRSSPSWLVAPAVMFVFLLIVVVLLINMLIAMMAKVGWGGVGWGWLA